MSIPISTLLIAKVYHIPALISLITKPVDHDIVQGSSWFSKIWTLVFSTAKQVRHESW